MCVDNVMCARSRLYEMYDLCGCDEAPRHARMIMN